MKEDVVVVSDLHMDFWSKKEGDDYQGQTKKKMWADFIESIQDSTRLFVINGDPLDIPSTSGKTIEPEQTPLLSPLENLVLSGTKILYVIGNHDIGIAGLRIEPEESQLPNVLSGVTVNYPHSLVESGGKTYFLEHGDYLEPFWVDTALALCKYAWKALFDRGQPRDLVRLSTRVRQRRARYMKGAPPKPPPPGVINQPRSFSDRLWRRYPEEICELKRANWRHAAQKKLKSFQSKSRKKGINLSGIIFGHTHLPDEAKLSTDSAEAVYCNSGSWAKDVPCATYLVIKPDGNLKRRCFWDKKRGQDLTNETCNLMLCAKDRFEHP